jgi:hypothetical protein
MLKIMKRYTFYAAMLLALASCSGSRITNVWKAKDAEHPVYSKVMVVGLIKDSDHALRDRMETHFVGDLTDLGYSAISSYQLYGPKAFEGLNEKQVINKIRNSGVDAVITIVLLDKTRERYYVPGKIYYSPYSIHSNNFWGYYSTMYGRIYEPGYYKENTKYFLESNLYDLRANKLVYSIQTQSFDPASVESLGHEYGRLIVKAMVKDNVLQKHAAPLSLNERE